ncbi:hypothetical protein F2Q70_00026054 [Brassica cretica]|uniref:Uncharacterized protein n=1 Tax=Brassica cretica TaxID=69181 RepID=A0A3N6PSI4_BRACR|nr:hypothetical protein F2Q68_00010261 [Brassica cretica]KAF2603343.1 hypothetical protein F2Q70_00026054 [Brassica cretica]
MIPEYFSPTTIAVDEQDNPSESTPREAELQRNLDGLQRQVTDLHKALEATENPKLSSEVQSLKEKLDEFTKHLEQSAEKITQLESEILVLRDKNQALNTASNKKRRFRTQVRSMPSLDTPNTAGDFEKETSEGAAALQSLLNTYLEQMFSKNLDAMQSMVERLPGVAPPIRKSNPGSYADTAFTDNIALI